MTMMRSYNKKIIPVYVETCDKLYVDDLIKSSPPTFSPEKKVRALIRDYRLSQDPKLRDRLVKMYGRYVISIAKNYQSQGLPLCDLISEGMIGLLCAIENYDTENLTKFITYSNVVISRQMREALDAFNNPVHIPKHIRNLKTKTKEVVNNMAGRGAEEQDILDTVEYEQIKYVVNPDIHKKLRLSSKAGSSEDSEGWSHENSLQSTHVLPDNELHKADLIKLIDALFKIKLTDVESSVLRMFFGMNDNISALSTGDIGDVLGLSGERARQLKESGLKKLRDAESMKLLREYL